MEFLIQTVDGSWFEFPEGCGQEVFLPHNLDAKLEPNSDVVKVIYKGCEFSFSVEEPGIQVVLESGAISESEAKVFLQSVIKTLEAKTNQSCEYIHYE